MLDPGEHEYEVLLEVAVKDFRGVALRSNVGAPTKIHSNPN